MTPQADYPAFDDLPRLHGVPTAWDYAPRARALGRWLHQTPQSVAGAARIVETGNVFPLDIDPALMDPPLFGRHPARHRRLEFDDGTGLDDVLHDYHPQAASQWDALGHIGILPDLFHGGVTRSDIDTGRSGTTRRWAQQGIAGRGLLLDLELAWGTAGTDYDPATSLTISVDDLEDCRAATGLAYATGDILLLHTGFLRWYSRQPAHARHALATSQSPHWIGLAHTEEMARYLWNTGCAAVATDTPALEVWPPDKTAAAWPWGYLHRVLLAGLGIAIGELWWLADLAHHCHTIRRHQTLVTSAPWHHPTTVGSPANALAIT